MRAKSEIVYCMFSTPQSGLGRVAVGMRSPPVLLLVHGLAEGSHTHEYPRQPATSLADITDAERQARVDLAAVYRLCVHYGWGDVIYNHCAMRVPGEDGKFLMKRHDFLVDRGDRRQSRQGRHAR